MSRLKFAIIIVLLFAFIFGFGFLQTELFAEEEEEPIEYPSPPLIKTVYPNYWRGGEEGTLITISGEYFYSAITEVEIGDKIIKAGDEDWRATGSNYVTINVSEMPEGITEPLLIKIIRKDGSSAELPNAFTFSKDSNPEIYSVEPTAGGTMGGTPVTIKGSNFRQSVDRDGTPLPPEVRFGDQLATDVTVVSTKEIIAITPPSFEEGTVKVSVRNPGQTTWVDAPEDFEYIIEGKLIKILNITPDEGTMNGGTPIAIRGVNFPTSMEEFERLEVLIGDVPVQSGSISIEPYGYFIDEIDGDYNEDDVEFVDGRPFLHYKDENGNKIYIIHAVTASSKFPGKQDVQVLVQWKEGIKNGRTEIDILPEGFNYYFPKTFPHITEVINTLTGTSVGPVGGGHTIEIRGSGFEAGAEVYFGANQAKILSLTSTLIRVELPEGEIAGPVDVLVRNKTLGEVTGESLLIRGFTYRGTSMQISSVTPNYATTAEIKSLVITGENFNEDILDNTTVYFEFWTSDPENPEEMLLRRETLNKISFDPSIGTLLFAETPLNPAAGKKDLVVENSYGRAVLKNAFEFRSPDIQPEIETVTAVVYEGDLPPSPRGSTGGGTSFIIRGNNFTSGTKVYIDGVLAPSIDVRSFNEIEAVSPPGTPGWKDVMVEGLTGKTDTMIADPEAEEGKKGFYYYSEPKITNITPSRGSILGGNIITITGEQFYPGAKVDFGYYDKEEKFLSVTEAVYELVVINEKTIKLRLPKLKEGEEPGEYLVKVTNTDNRSTTWSKKFLFKEPDLENKIAIYSVNPAIGQVEGGTKVSIRGENFHPDAVVHFGWEQAAIESINDNEIIVIIPPNEAGKYLVTVSNYADTGTAIWEPFEYLDPTSIPKITGIFPHMGPIDGGTKIILTGVGFWPGAKLYIGGKPASNVEANYTYITGETPKGDKVGLADVMVVNPDGGMDILFDGFAYKFPDSEPKIISVDPNKIPASGGTVVTIEGEDFRKDLTVFFGSEKAEIVEFIEPTTIIVKAPPYTLGEEGIVDVTVLNRDGGVAQSKTDEQRIHYFLDRSEPVIDKITPERGPAAGGNLVIIEGDGFSSKGVKVYFGGREAELAAAIRYDRLEVIAPPGEPGSHVHVTVMNTHDDALGSATLYNAYTYEASKPVITSVAPNQATHLGGTTITIRGSGFTTAGAKVFIREWEGLDVNVHDSETITFITPEVSLKELEELGGLRWWDVKVINADGIEALKKEAFRYLYPDSDPRIISIDPVKGSTQGGMPLTIIGSDFRLGAKVVIGGKEAEVLSIDDSPGEGNAKIIVRTPPHTPGPKDVTVINYEGAISNSVTFTYETPLSFPEINNLDPKQGATLGDTEVIITGIGFKKDARVWFGLNEAEKVEFIDYRTLKVITPPGPEGLVDVLVLNPDMGQASLAKGFRYIKAKEFVVESITPNEGSADGGTAITIKGGPFEVGVTVHIGDNSALEVERVDGETITAITPPGQVGWQDVKVKNPDGGFVVVKDGFYYFKPRTAPETPGWVDSKRKDRDTIEVIWEPAEFANYYEIWISNTRGGKYVFLDQTVKTVYYATGLDLNKTYYFQIRAINELGVSGFSYYTYSRTGSGLEPKADLIPKEIAIQGANGKAIASIARGENLLYSAYMVDFDQLKYRNFPEKIVRISRDALLEMNWPVLIKAPNIEITVHPASLYLSMIGLQDVYGEFTLTDLGAREAEKALRGLPRGSRIISPVYGIKWQIVDGYKKILQDNFSRQVNLVMKYDPKQRTGKEISLFAFNPSNGKWVNTGATHDGFNPRLILGINNPGKFVLVEH